MPSLAEAEAPTTRSHGDAPLTPVHQIGGGQRIIFANELLDALPVHRLGWEATTRSWFEWGVARQDDRFVWTRLRESDSSREYRGPSPTVPAPLAAVLPDGYTIEVSPAATDWWRLAAKVLGRGKLLAIDYGRSADELLKPERQAGTLRAYHGHRSSRDVLAEPGEQDLTADVDFTAIQSAGEEAGLVTEAFLMQSQFLTPIAARAWHPASCFGDWTAERTRQFQTLAHPEHLGRSFRVLLQSRATRPVQSTVDCSS
jgi:SAM-dependent MidA family methyltransferase